MRNREHEVILGAVVFVAVVILVVGSMWLSDRYAGAAGGYKLNVVFDRVPGIQVGNPVTFRGIRVGKVLNVWLEKGKPVVEVGFAKLRALPKDSDIMIKADGLLGGQMVEIHLGGASETWPDGAYVKGAASSGLEDVMYDGGRLVTKINTTMDHMASPENLAHIGKTLARLDSTTAMLNALLARNRANLDGVLDSLALASGDASGILRDNRSDLRESIKNAKQSTEHLAQLTEQVTRVAASLKTTCDNLNQISGRIRDGKGSLGRLVQDDQVYLHLERTLTAVDSLIEDIRRDPTRYFHFSVF